MDEADAIELAGCLHDLLAGRESVWISRCVVESPNGGLGDKNLRDEISVEAVGGDVPRVCVGRETLLDALLAAVGRVRLKRCSRCGENLPLEQFKKDATRRDGHFPYCKSCCSRLKRGEDLPKLDGPRRRRKGQAAPATIVATNVEGEPEVTVPAAATAETNGHNDVVVTTNGHAGTPATATAGHKQCPRCLASKPLEDFRPDPTRRDGVFPYCLGCVQRINGGESLPKHGGPQQRRDAAAGVPAGHKRCRCCDVVKPREDFFARARSADGLHDWCKVCYKRRRRTRKPRQAVWQLVLT